MFTFALAETVTEPTSIVNVPSVLPPAKAPPAGLSVPILPTALSVKLGPVPVPALENAVPVLLSVI